MDESKPAPERPLFDVTGMTVADAKDYTVSIVAHLKQTEAELVAADEDAQTWAARVRLAEEQANPELQAQAEAKRVEAVDRRSRLELEAVEFRDGVEKLKKQLQLLPLTQRTINTDALLESLAHLGGPLDNVTPVARRAEADDALAALKKRLAEGR